MADGKKYYAYTAGDETGIALSWDECQGKVKGVKGAKYKAFLSYKAALSWISGDDTDYAEQVLPYLTDGWAVAYTDGSFEQGAGLYSYGVCLFLPGEDYPVRLSGIGQKEEYLPHRNIAGEILGVIKAVESAKEKGCQKVLIYHDYNGLGYWADGAWKQNTKLSKNFRQYIKEQRQFIEISFINIKGHSGNKYNECVDSLAKGAIAGKTQKVRLFFSKMERLDVEETAVEVSSMVQTNNVSDGDKITLTHGEDVVIFTITEKGVAVEGMRSPLLLITLLDLSDKISRDKLESAFKAAYPQDIPEESVEKKLGEIFTNPAFQDVSENVHMLARIAVSGYLNIDTCPERAEMYTLPAAYLAKEILKDTKSSPLESALKGADPYKPMTKKAAKAYALTLLNEINLSL